MSSTQCTLGFQAYWAAAEGGKTYHVSLAGGGDVLQSVLSKTTFAGLRKSDWSGLCPFPLRKMTGRVQNVPGNRIIGGGVQNRFLGRVLWCVFPSSPSGPGEAS